MQNEALCASSGFCDVSVNEAISRFLKDGCPSRNTSAREQVRKAGNSLTTTTLFVCAGMPKPLTAIPSTYLQSLRGRNTMVSEQVTSRTNARIVAALNNDGRDFKRILLCRVLPMTTPVYAVNFPMSEIINSKSLRECDTEHNRY
jgi:hypothetical protein